MKKEERQLMEKYLIKEHEEGFFKRLSHIIPDFLVTHKITKRSMDWIETEGTKLWKKRWDYTDSEYEREVDKLVDRIKEYIKSYDEGSVYLKSAQISIMRDLIRKELKREVKK